VIAAGLDSSKKHDQLLLLHHTGFFALCLPPPLFFLSFPFFFYSPFSSSMDVISQVDLSLCSLFKCTWGSSKV
jgi:hypothetical protein